MPLLTHNALRVTERTIRLPRLPEALDGLRVVQLSDLHFYEHSDPDYYQQVVDRLNQLAPDIAVLTGDIVHYGKTHLPMAQAVLSRITTPGLRLAILGNHDYQDEGWSQNVRAMLTHSGFDLLVNQHRVFERQQQRLWLAGLDDLWYGRPDIAAALDGVPCQTEPVLMLVHNPLLFDPIALGAHGPVDLVVAGHTHAGHVYIPFLRPIYRYFFRMKYCYGLYQKRHCQLHVTSGVGSAAFYLKKWRIGFPRFRFNTHPELAVLTLRRGPQPGPNDVNASS